VKLLKEISASFLWSAYEQLLLRALDLYRDEGIGIPDMSSLMDLGFSMEEAEVLVSQLESEGLNPSGDPFAGELTLTSFERMTFQDAIDDFNSMIEEVASEFDIPLVDINSFLSTLNSEGIDGFSGSFVLVDSENTTFSLDGIHLNNAGYALAANEFIKVMNQSFGFNIPLLETQQFAGQYAN